MPISFEAFSRLEKILHLHPSTLPSFFNLNGSYASYSTFNNGVKAKQTGIGTVFNPDKTPDKC
jgi:folate-dependent phosphoribosylglycinamide formyltransferase PurN